MLTQTWFLTSCVTPTMPDEPTCRLSLHAPERQFACLVDALGELYLRFRYAWRNDCITVRCAM